MSKQYAYQMEDNKQNNNEFASSMSLQSIVTKLGELRNRSFPDNDQPARNTDNSRPEPAQGSAILSNPVKTSKIPDVSSQEHPESLSTCAMSEPVIEDGVVGWANENASKRKSSRPCKYEAPAKKMLASAPSCRHGYGQDVVRNGLIYDRSVMYNPQVDGMRSIGTSQMTGFINSFNSEMRYQPRIGSTMVGKRKLYTNFGRTASLLKIRKARSTVRGPISCIVRKLLAEVTNSVVAIVNKERCALKKAGRKPKLWTSSVAHLSLEDLAELTHPLRIPSLDESEEKLSNRMCVNSTRLGPESEQVGEYPFPLDIQSCSVWPLKQKRRRGRPSHRDKMLEMLLEEVWDVISSLVTAVCRQVDGTEIIAQCVQEANAICTGVPLQPTHQIALQRDQRGDMSKMGFHRRIVRQRRPRGRPCTSANASMGGRGRKLRNQREPYGCNGYDASSQMCDLSQIDLFSAILPWVQLATGQFDPNALNHLLASSSSTHQTDFTDQASSFMPSISTNNVPDMLPSGNDSTRLHCDEGSMTTLRFQRIIASAAIMAASQTAASLLAGTDSLPPLSVPNLFNDFPFPSPTRSYQSHPVSGISTSSLTTQPIEPLRQLGNSCPMGLNNAIDTSGIAEQMRSGAFQAISDTGQCEVEHPFGSGGMFRTSFANPFTQPPGCHKPRGSMRGRRGTRARYPVPLTHEDISLRNNCLNNSHQPKSDSNETSRYSVLRGLGTQRFRNPVGRPPGSRKYRVTR